MEQQLSCNPPNVRFGTMVLGQTETVAVSLTNTGSTSVTVTAVNTSISAFSVAGLTLPFTLTAGQGVNVNLMFTPSVAGWAVGTFSFVSNASNEALYVGAGGVGVAASRESMTPNPSTLAFGNVAVGSTSTLPIVLTNSGSSNIRVTQVQLTGAGFTPTGLNLPVVLAPQQTLAFNVVFAPQSAGAAGGSVFVPSGGLTIPLSGMGTSTQGQLVVAPAPLNFGNVTVGSTETEPITMSASGASVTVSSASSSSSQFVLDGATFPFTIAAGASVSFNVAFTPQTSGTLSGALSFASNASNSSAPESLTGVGVLPQQTVNLWWNSSSGVSGYNVYRSTSSNGTYAKINSTLDPNVSYIDSTVASGQTYYYAATSVNSGGQESAKSAPVQAVVP
jgi:hypothetical protein